MQISSVMYPNVNAKLKGMYAKKIKKADLEELIKQNSIEQVIALLKTMNSDFRELEENPKRLKIKIFLDNHLIKDIQKISRLLEKKDKKVFLKFISNYEIKCIKSVFRKLLSENKINEQSNEIENWVDKVFRNLRGIETIESQEEFLGFIKRTKKYRFLLKKFAENKENLTIFEMENSLDKFYFERMIKLAKGYNSSLEDMLGQKIDLNHVIWIYREKTNYEFKVSQVKDTLIPVHYRLKKVELEKLMQANDEKEFIQILKETVYAKAIPFDDMENLESNVDRYLYKLYQSYFRKNIFDIGALYAYMNIMELENNSIMNIVEGIRYHLDKEKIRQLVV